MILFCCDNEGEMETSDSISRWAQEVFGELSPVLTAERIQEELDELLTELYCSRGSRSLPSKLALEFADVAICLAVAAAASGVDLGSAVMQKMAINRDRRWVRTGGGTGKHVDKGGDQ